MIEATPVSGFVLGAGTSVFIAFLARGRKSERASKAGGLAVVAGMLLYLVVTASAPPLLYLSVLGLVGGGLLWNRHRPLAIVVVAVSAWPLVALTPLADRRLFQVGCALYVVGAGWAVLEFESMRGRFSSLLLAIAFLGMYLTLPSPGLALALVGASFAFLVIPYIQPEAAFALMGLVVWVSALGGQARTGSIVGALAGMGVLMLYPIARRASPRLSPWLRVLDDRLLTGRLLLATHLLMVTITSRVAGFRIKSEPALALAALAFALGWSLMAIGPGRGRGPSRSSEATSVD